MSVLSRMNTIQALASYVFQINDKGKVIPLQAPVWPRGWVEV